MDKSCKAVVLPTQDVWEIVNYYDRTVTDDIISSVVLEALTRLFIDTPIGDEIGSIWEQKRGGADA